MWSTANYSFEAAMAVVSVNSGTVSLKPPVPNETLQRMFTDQFCDVDLFGKRGQSCLETPWLPVKAHRSVLANCASQRLKNLFSDGNRSEYRFENINHRALGRIIRYLYSETLTFPMDSQDLQLLKDVLIGADYLGLNELKTGAEQALIKATKIFFTKLSRGPAELMERQLLAASASMLVFAGIHACDELRALAYSYVLADLIASKALDVPVTSEVLQLPYADLRTLMVCLPTAASQVVTICSWVGQDNSREGFAPDLIRLVDMSRLSSDMAKQLCESPALFGTGGQQTYTRTALNEALRARMPREEVVID